MFYIRTAWQEGALFMTQFTFDNYATYGTREKVACDLFESCKVSDEAIKKAMRK